MSTSRLLHLSDLHANDAWFEWVKTIRDPYGLLVVSGDLLNLNARAPLGEQVPRVTAHLSALASAPLALVSGNHDGLPERSHEFRGLQWMGRLRTDSPRWRRIRLCWVHASLHRLGRGRPRICRRERGVDRACTARWSDDGGFTGRHKLRRLGPGPRLRRRSRSTASARRPRSRAPKLVLKSRSHLVAQSGLPRG